MSQASYGNPGGVVVQKPKWDVYTTMLMLSFLAIVIAITLLWLEMNRYNRDINATETKRAAFVVPVEGPVFAGHVTPAGLA